MIPNNRKPTHPGEILLEEFLKPMEMSQVELAKRMGVPIQRVNTLINGKRDMTAETAILLARVLKTSSEFWMNLQVGYDLYKAMRSMEAASSTSLTGSGRPRPRNRHSTIYNSQAAPR
jgi:addiction module HigA family antidote